MTLFANRTEAGKVLAKRLQHLAGRTDVVVLALPRGGVPVAVVVARDLDAPLDVLVVRKIGAPGHEEFAIGAIASGNVRVLSHNIIDQLGISPERLDELVERQQAELERRERQYRGDRPFPDLEDQTVIVVDDGLATGSTMEAAVKALRQHHPRKIIVAVPVAPPNIPSELSAAADEVIAVHQPPDFQAVGQFYRRFSQTSDDEVRELLAAHQVSEKS